MCNLWFLHLAKRQAFVTVFTQLMYTSTACLLSIFTAESLHHTVQMANVETMWELYSLVPRPSHHPVFDRLQYAKTEGEGLVSFYHVNDVSVYLGRQRGGGVSDRILRMDCSF